MTVIAKEAIRRLHGGAQSQLMLDTDNQLWVVKFQNNPQGIRILANDFIVSRLAEVLGLPVPRTEIIEVSDSVVADPQMFMEGRKNTKQSYVAGLQFGSLFMGGLWPGLVVEHPPLHILLKVPNLGDFPGALALDKWTGNCDGRQVVFHRTRSQRNYRVAFIDQGFCFNGNDWNFPDRAIGSGYGRQDYIVYDQVKGWKSFEPWLERIKTIDWNTLWAIAESVPPVWYEGQRSALLQLMEQLFLRRSRVAELIAAFRDSNLDPFHYWGLTSAERRNPVN